MLSIVFIIDIKVPIFLFKLDAKTLKDHGIRPPEITTMKDASAAAKKIEMVRIL
jgi:hypothetical protein